MRKFLSSVTKVSQMSNPIAGTGKGNNQCTEAVCTMIDCTYKIGPSAQAGVNPQDIMLDFTRWLNHGSNFSALENPVWIAQWVSKHTNGKITLPSLSSPSFADYKTAINAGHMTIIQVRDCGQLRLFNNASPYPFKPSGGHVVAGIGYDDNFENQGQSAVLNDPLQSISRQPYDYSWGSIVRAGIIRLFIVQGPPLV